MPRRTRLWKPNLPWHIIQRGNNRHAFFYPDADCQACLRWLGEAPKKAACALHA